MVYHYGMSEAISKHRTSFALDEATADRLRRLSRIWGVSQAEVVRRAVRLADESSASRLESVAERLEAYQKGERLDRRRAEDYLDQVHADRGEWFGIDDRS